MRAEILTGAERRRRWSTRQKLAILEDADRPDVRVAEAARRHDVTRQQIYSWRAMRKKGLLGPEAPTGGEVVRFMALDVDNATAAPVSSSGALAAAEPSAAPGPEPGPAPGPAAETIEIALMGGRVLRAPASLPAATLRRLIRVVEEA